MRVNFHQDFATGGLNIYFLNDEGTEVMVPDSVGPYGTISWRTEPLDEAVVPTATLRLASVYAQPFEEGFKRYLGERNHIVPEKVYEREAARVDKLIDAMIKPPVVVAERYREVS